MKNYKNPVLLCDYSDPDVIRVDDTFYMTASSFNFTPGLPVLASKNLVDWTLVNYAAENIPISRYDFPRNSEGIWAPSICFHNGKYYIITGLPDDGIYITETEDPFSRWKPLRCIRKGAGLIDPCLFWDDDGKVYVIHAYAKSRAGFNSKIAVLQADSQTLDCGSADDSSVEDKVIFDGSETQPTIEGPKIYKRGGFYYIFAPAGGVTAGWQTVLRSENIFGPYEDKIVLATGNSKINGPHQGALVETQSGESWFLHFQDRGIYGRVTHLEPVVWKDGWPCIGTAAKSAVLPGEPVSKYRMPKIKASSKKILPKSDCVRAFPGADLNWQWSANHEVNFAWSATEKSEKSFYLNVLNLTEHTFQTYASSSAKSKENELCVLWNAPNLLTRKIRKESFRFYCQMNVAGLPLKARAGIVFIGNEYGSLAVERTEEGLDLLYFEGYTSETSEFERLESELHRVSIPDSSAFRNQIVNFKLEFIPIGQYEGLAVFELSIGKFKWHSEPYSTEEAFWVGGRFGVYAIGKEKGKVLVTMNDKYC